MVRDSYSPRRSYNSENPNSRSRTSKSSMRDHDDSPRRESRYADREYGEHRRDDRNEPRSSRGRDDYNREYSRYRDRDRRDRSDYDTRERERARVEERRDRDSEQRRETPRDGPSRRSASPRRYRSQSRPKSKSRSKSPEDKAKPNFAPSGLLAAATKTVEHKDGTKTVLKYHEPPEARKPSVGWRLYVFKGQEQVGECISALFRLQF